MKIFRSRCRAVQNPSSPAIAASVVAILLFCNSRDAQAQGTARAVARVAVVQRVTEKRSGTATWVKAGLGDALNVGDGFRTGKRSKADIKFGDGSLLRLGQLSSVEMRGTRRTSLLRGQLLFSALRPGRVLAGAAAAEVKGSVVRVRLSARGVASIALYAGAVDVVTSQGTVSVPLGQEVDVAPDGTISPPHIAPPLQFTDEDTSELLIAPTNVPFMGSRTQRNVLRQSSRLVQDATVQQHKFESSLSSFNSSSSPRGVIIESVVAPGGSPGGPGSGSIATLSASSRVAPSLSRGGSSPASRSSFLPSSSLMMTSPLSGSPLLSAPMTPASTKPLVSALPLTPLTRIAALGAATPASGVSTSSTYAATSSAPTLEPRTLLAQAPPGTPGGGETAKTAAEIVNEETAEEAAEGAPSDLDLHEAYKHLQEADAASGRVWNGDVAVAGAYSDSFGVRSIGGRLHGSAALDNFFAEVAFRPLRLRTDLNTVDYSAFSNASLTFLNKKVEIQAGRQLFLQGPTHNTLYGSILRRRGHEVMDAIRIAPLIGEGRQLEFAYLIDAFPRNLPYRKGVDGRQDGFYGRLGLQKRFGNFGVNLLKYRDKTVGDKLGASFDFAVPLFKDKVEVYGELGRDTFERGLTSLGANFPVLYDKTGFDLYIEYAKLHNHNGVTGLPKELTVRLYRSLGDNVSAVASWTDFTNTNTVFTIGLAFGIGTSN